MTDPTRRCRWCRRALPERTGPGRPRQFCSQACRQWDWVSRQQSADRGLDATQIIVDRTQLDGLLDDLYVLECAVDDTDRDRAEAGDDARELRRMLDWLLDACRPLVDRQLTPS